MSVDQSRIVIIGAGASGRGHLGQVAHAAGWSITFIDRDRNLVDILQRSGTFTVGLAGEQVEDVVVTGFRSLHVDDIDACANAIAEADIVATCVLPTNLPSTTATFAAGFRRRQELGVEKPLNVIAAENMERSTSVLLGFLREGAPQLDWQWIEAHTGFPDSMIARAVPVPKTPLFLISEKTQEWSVDLKGLQEPMPRMAGMTLSPNQDAALEKKLYIKNTGHMAIGILGYLAGYELMDQAMRDPGIFDLVDRATQESAAAVIRKHRFDADEIERYRSGFLEAMKSPFLPDEIIRVIRQPLRKLTREERLVGPAMLACEQGTRPEALAAVIAKALTLAIPDDHQCQELQELMNTLAPDVVLEKVADVPRDHRLAKMVAEIVQ
ncbi:MAG: hypothetical protein WCL39_01360 [Armatimonadota bacterium]